MKYLFVLLGLMISVNISAQKENLFVRVFDLKDKIIARGKIIAISDTSIQLMVKDEIKLIAANTIGLVKTKHSARKSIAIGAVIGTTLFGVLGATENGSGSGFNFFDSRGEEAVIMGLIGGVIGAAIGGATAFSRNNYRINGDELEWKDFRKSISEAKF